MEVFIVSYFKYNGGKKSCNLDLSLLLYFSLFPRCLVSPLVEEKGIGQAPY